MSPTRRLSLVLLGLALAGCPRAGEIGTKHHYDDKEAALARFEEPERDAWAKPAEVIAELDIQPEMDVADIGAGSGYFTRRLATAANRGTTYAIDVDADFKDHIEAKLEVWQTPNIVTRLAVYEHPLLPQDSVDLVFISNTYSFLQERVTYFQAVHKALRRKGRLAVIDWRADAKCPKKLDCPRPSKRVPEDIARAELAEAGFVVLERFDFLPYQYFLLLGRAEDQALTEQPEPPGPEQPDPDAGNAPEPAPAEAGEQPPPEPTPEP